MPLPDVCEVLTQYYLTKGPLDPVVASNLAKTLVNAGCPVPSTTTSSSTTTIGPP